MIEKQNADEMLANGGRVIAATPTIFDQIVAMANESLEQSGE